MKIYILLFSLAIGLLSCQFQEQEKQSNSSTTEKNFAIAIHGGAGTILKENMTTEMENAYKAKLQESITTGYSVLKNGGTSLEAVEKAIQILENSPLFNAGKGAVFTNAETNEMDAAIMLGKNKKAGAVAGVKTIKNPISAAIAVMEKTEHVLLTGTGADSFAKEIGLPVVDPSYFYTERRFNALQRTKNKKESAQHTTTGSSFYDTDIKNVKFGTVGCVALDKEGNIAAGTSTGGMTNKRWNRVGDTPIIGAGTYANNATCGISATGWGEYFIRNVVAYDISAQMEYKKSSLEEATKDVIHNKLTSSGGTGGVIAIDKNGTISFAFNTAGMYRASIDSNGKQTIKIYKE